MKGSVRDANWMFCSTIPIASDDEKGWAHCAFEKAQNESNGTDAAEGVRSG